jgi:hypothetical protein
MAAATPACHVTFDYLLFGRFCHKCQISRRLIQFVDRSESASNHKIEVVE